MFLDRFDAANQLATKFLRRHLWNPLVLAIPQGGVVVGAVVAQHLAIELDVVLSCKLYSPDQPGRPVGAISEQGEIYLSSTDHEHLAHNEKYLTAQLDEVRRRLHVFRAVRPAANIVGRCVLIVDDGVATGATMIAALQAIRKRLPRQLIAAAPVIPQDRLAELRNWADEVVYLLSPQRFSAASQFYGEFNPVTEPQAVALFRHLCATGHPCAAGHLCTDTAET